MGKRHSTPVSMNFLQKYKKSLQDIHHMIVQFLLRAYDQYHSSEVDKAACIESIKEEAALFLEVSNNHQERCIFDFFKVIGLGIEETEDGYDVVNWSEVFGRFATKTEWEQFLNNIPYGPKEILDPSQFSRNFQLLVLRSFHPSAGGMLSKPAFEIPGFSTRSRSTQWQNNPMYLSRLCQLHFNDIVEKYLFMTLRMEEADFSKDHLTGLFKNYILRSIKLNKVALPELGLSTDDLIRQYREYSVYFEEAKAFNHENYFAIGLVLLKLWPDLADDEAFMHVFENTYRWRFPTIDEKLLASLSEEFPELLDFWSLNRKETDQAKEHELQEAFSMTSKDPVDEESVSEEESTGSDTATKETRVLSKKAELSVKADNCHEEDVSHGALLEQGESSRDFESAQHTDIIETLHAPTPSYEYTPIQQRLSMGNRTVAYLGYVRTNYGNCLNFYPTAELYNGALSPIHDAKDRWPGFGAINLNRGAIRLNSGVRFSPNCFYFAQIERTDIEDNIDTNTGLIRTDYSVKVRDLDQLCRDKLISPIEDEGGYFIVYPLNPESVKLNETIPVSFSQTSLSIDDSMKYARARVVLAYDEKFFGPVRLTVLGNQLSVNFKDEYRDGVVHFYKSNNSFRTKHSNFIAAFEEKVYSPRDILLTHNEYVTESWMDFWSDTDLLDRLLKQSRDLNSDQYQIVQDWLTHADDEKVLTESIAINRYRQQRLDYFSQCLKVNRYNQENYIEAVNNLLTANRDSDRLTEIVDLIAKREDILEKFISFQAIKEKEKSLQGLVRQLKTEKTDLENQIKQRKSKLAASHEQEIQKLEKQIRDELAKLENVVSYKELLKKENLLKKELRAKSQHVESLDAKAGELEKEISSLSDRLLEAVKPAKMREIAFEPVLAHKFTQAAATWAEKEKADRESVLIEALNTIGLSSLKDRDLVNYLVNATQKHRGYSRNAILNLYICLAQNFLTVLAGKPGSGKTSICDIMAHVMGLNALASRTKVALTEDQRDFVNRYLPVSVERGWTSKRDFLGYYNPLNQTFESQDPRRHMCFKMLDREAVSNTCHLPYVVLLDEANLSQMEYYWADFMNICDARNASSAISLGDGRHYHIPDTLRFVATINSDQTTESLSPRLIDRSWIVTLPTPMYDSFDDFHPMTLDPEDESVEIVSWPEIQQALGQPRALPSSAKRLFEEILNAFYGIFQGLGYSVSFRSRKAIANYVSVASYWFEGTNDQQKQVVAVDYAIAQKLLPCISLVGGHYENSLTTMIELCDKYGLSQSKLILLDILERGKRSMDMFTFF